MTPGRSLTAAMIVFALVVVPIAAYVGGYYGLQWDTHEAYGQVGGMLIARVYRYQWQADAFSPAASVEEWLTDNEVRTLCYDDLQE